MVDRAQVSWLLAPKTKREEVDKVLRLAVIVACLACLMPLADAGATSSMMSSSGNIAVSPAIEQINLKAGQTSTSFTTAITNNNKSPVGIEISMNDFTALNETGSVSFLGTNYPGNSLHGLAAWMHAATPSISIAPGASQTIPISIPDTRGLAPGGHYGAVIFRVIPTTGSGKGQLSTNEEISTLVFLTTYSGRTQAISLQKPALNSIFTAMPSSLNLVFTSTGNTQTTPHGLVTVLDSKNKEIARGIINVDSGLVLPSTSRLYQVNLRYTKHTFRPGTYHIRISYQAGDIAAAQIYSKSFWYVSRSVIVAVMVIALVIILLVVYKTGRHYKKYKAKP
jgi:hypothetical protein